MFADGYAHSVPVLDRPRASIRMGFCRGCRGMTGYGLGRGTSLLLILIFILASAMLGVSEPWSCKVSKNIYILCGLSVATAISQPVELN
jgi:hypothetical protein